MFLNLRQAFQGTLNDLQMIDDHIPVYPHSALICPSQTIRDAKHNALGRIIRASYLGLFAEFYWK